mmetsp:Transcript_31807/g.58057  ORF Transcript_31807/g.58057 Transcript_31807/m.58057 type:complete len:378 (+) Transcript_31807:160-1293(+)
MNKVSIVIMVNLFSLTTTHSFQVGRIRLVDVWHKANNEPEPAGIEIAWPSLIDALKCYHDAYGDLIIPSSFVVPTEEPWPSALHDTRLAALVYNIEFWRKYVRYVPRRRDELSELGYVWGRVQTEYNLILEALAVYRSCFGDLCVSSSFTVPTEDPWPKSVWKMPLGARVSAIRSRGHYVGKNGKRFYQLDSMGFVWEASDPLWERFFTALEAYFECHGNSMVHRQFVVPNDGECYPKTTHGLKLGRAVSNLRTKGTFRINENPHRARGLARLNFVFDLSEYAFEQLVMALTVYRDEYGHVQVPRTFIVPAEHPWPEHCWGYKLGIRVSAVRTRGGLVKSSPQRLHDLNRLGFVWNPPRGKRGPASEVQSSSGSLKQ